MENNPEYTGNSEKRLPTGSCGRMEVAYGATSPVSADPGSGAEVPHLVRSSSGEHAGLPDAQQSCTAAADHLYTNASSRGSVESAVLEDSCVSFDPPKVNVGLVTVKSKQSASITNKPIYVLSTSPNHSGSDSVVCLGSGSVVVDDSEGAVVGATGKTNTFSAGVTQPGPPKVLHTATPHQPSVETTCSYTIDSDVARDTNQSSVGISANLSATLSIHSSRRPRSTILPQGRTASTNLSNDSQEQGWKNRPLHASLSMSSLSQVDQSDVPSEPNPMFQLRYKSPFAQRTSRYPNRAVYTSCIAQHAQYTPHPTVHRSYTSPFATIHHYSSHSSLHTDQNSGKRSHTQAKSDNVPSTLPAHAPPHSPPVVPLQSRKLPQVPLTSPSVMAQPTSSEVTLETPPHTALGKNLHAEILQKVSSTLPNSTPQTSKSSMQTSSFTSQDAAIFVAVEMTSPAQTVAAGQNLDSCDRPQSASTGKSALSNQVPSDVNDVTKTEKTLDQEVPTPMPPNLGTHPLLLHENNSRNSEILDQQGSNVSTIVKRVLESKLDVIETSIVPNDVVSALSSSVDKSHREIEPGFDLFPPKSPKQKDSFFQNLLLKEQSKLSSSLNQLPSNDSSVQVTPKNDVKSLTHDFGLSDPIRVFVGKSLTDLQYTTQLSHSSSNLSAQPSSRVPMLSSVDNLKKISETPILSSAKLVSDSSKYLSSQSASNLTQEKAGFCVSVPDLFSKMSPTSPADIDSERPGSVVDIRKLIKAFEGNSELSLKAKPFELEKRYQPRSYQQQRAQVQDNKFFSNPSPQPLNTQGSATDKKALSNIYRGKDDASVLSKEPIRHEVPAFQPHTVLSRTEDPQAGSTVVDLKEQQRRRHNLPEEEVSRNFDEKGRRDVRPPLKQQQRKDHRQRDEKGLRTGCGRMNFIAEELKLQKEKEKEHKLQNKKLQLEYEEQQQQRKVLGKQKEHHLPKQMQQNEQDSLEQLPHQGQLQRQRQQEEVEKRIQGEALQKQQQEQELQRQRQEQELQRQRQEQALEKQRQELELNKQRQEQELEKERQEQVLEKQRQEQALERERQEQKLEKRRQVQVLEKKRLEQELKKQGQEQELSTQRQEREHENLRLEQELAKYRQEQELLRQQELRERHQWLLEQQSLFEEEREKQQRLIEEQQRLLREEKRKMDEQRERLERLEKLHEKQLEFELHQLQIADGRLRVLNVLDKKAEEKFQEQFEQQVPNVRKELEPLVKVPGQFHPVTEKPQKLDQEQPEAQQQIEQLLQQQQVSQESQQQQETVQPQQTDKVQPQIQTDQIPQQRQTSQDLEQEHTAYAQPQAETAEALIQKQSSQSEQQAQQREQTLQAEQQKQTLKAHQQEQPVQPQQPKQTDQPQQQQMRHQRFLMHVTGEELVRVVRKREEQRQAAKLEEQLRILHLRDQEERMEVEQIQKNILEEKRRKIKETFEGGVERHGDGTEKEELRIPAVVEILTGVGQKESVVDDEPPGRPSEPLPDEDEIEADIDMQKVSDTDVQKLADSDVQKVADSDVQKVADSDVQKVADSEVQKVADSNGVQRHRDGTGKDVLRIPAVVEILIGVEQKISVVDDEPPGRPSAPLPDEDEIEADSDIQKVSDTDLQKVAASDVQKVAASDAQKVADSDVQKVAASDVQKVSASDVQEVADSDVQKVAASDVQKVAASDVREVADSDVQKVVETGTQKLPVIHVQKVVLGNEKKDDTIRPDLSQGSELKIREKHAPEGDEKHASEGDEKHAPEGDEKHAPEGFEKHASEGDEKHTPEGFEKHASEGDEKHAPKGDEKHASEGDEKHAPEGDEKHAPGSDEQHASEGDEKHAPESDEKHAPEDDEKRAPEGDEKHAPEGDEKHAPEGDEKHAPERGEKHAPEGDEKLAPEGDDKHAPEGDEKYAPEGDEKHAPEDDEKQAPEGDEKHAPEGDEKHAPEGDGEHAPKGVEKHAPEGDEKHAPEGDEKHSPEGDEKHAPEGDEKHAPEGGEKHAPEGDEKLAPEGDEKHAPEGDEKYAPEGDEKHAPKDDEKQAPEGDGKHAPEGDEKHAPEGDGEHAPKGVEKHAPEGDEKHEPEGDEKQAPEGDEKHAPEGDEKHAPEGDEKHAPEGDEKHAPEGDEKHAPEGDEKHAPEGDEKHMLEGAEKHAPEGDEKHAPEGDEKHAPEGDEEHERKEAHKQKFQKRDEQKVPVEAKPEIPVKDEQPMIPAKDVSKKLETEQEIDSDPTTFFLKEDQNTEQVMIREETRAECLGKQEKDVQHGKQIEQIHVQKLDHQIMNQQEKQLVDQQEKQLLHLFQQNQELQKTNSSDDSDTKILSVSQLKKEKEHAILMNDHHQQLMSKRQEQQLKQQEHFKQLEQVRNSSPAVADCISSTDNKEPAYVLPVTAQSVTDRNVLGDKVLTEDDNKCISAQVVAGDKSRSTITEDELLCHDSLPSNGNLSTKNTCAKRKESLDTVSTDDYYTASEGKPQAFDDSSTSGDKSEETSSQAQTFFENVSSHVDDYSLSAAGPMDASNTASVPLDFSGERRSILQQSPVLEDTSPLSTLSDTDQDYGDFTIDDSGDEISSKPALVNSTSSTLTQIQLKETISTDHCSPEPDSELMESVTLLPDSTPSSGDTPSASDSVATAFEVTDPLQSDEQGKHEEQLGDHFDEQGKHKIHSTSGIQPCTSSDDRQGIFSSRITIIPSIEISDTSREEIVSSDVSLINSDSSQVVSSLDENSHIPDSKDHHNDIPEVIPISCKVRDVVQVVSEVRYSTSVNNNDEIRSSRKNSHEKTVINDKSVQRQVDSEANRMLDSERDLESIRGGAGLSDDTASTLPRMEACETKQSHPKVDLDAARQASVESDGVGSGGGIIPVVEIITPSAFEDEPPVFDDRSQTTQTVSDAVLREDPNLRRCLSENKPDFGNGTSDTFLGEQIAAEGKDPSVYSSNFDTSASMYTNLATEGTAGGQGGSAVDTETFGGSLESFPLNSDDVSGAVAETGSFGGNNNNNNEDEIGLSLPRITNGGGGVEDGKLPKLLVNHGQDRGGRCGDQHLLGGGGCSGSVRSTPPKSPITVQEWVASLPYPAAGSDGGAAQAWDDTPGAEVDEGAEGGLGHEDGAPHDDLNLGAEAHQLAGNRGPFGGMRDCVLRLPPDRPDSLIRGHHPLHQLQHHTADQHNTRPSNTIETTPQLALHFPPSSTQHSQPDHHHFQPVSSSSSCIITAAAGSAFSVPLATGGALSMRAKWGQLAAKTVEEQQQGTVEQQTDSRDEEQERHQQQLSSQHQCLQEYVSGEPASAISAEKRQLLSGLRGKQHSFNSEASALSCNSRSSLESLLDARQNDAVEVLLSLGFGGRDQDQDPIARIPARFLEQPSQVRGNDLTTFLEQEDRCQQLLETNDWLPGLSYQGLRKASMSTSPLLSNLVESYQQSQYEEEFDELDELPPNANKFASLVNEVRKKGRLSRRSKSEQNFCLNGKVLPTGAIVGGMKRSGRLSVGCGWGGIFSGMKPSASGQMQNGNTDKDGDGGPKKSRWLSVLTPENRNFLNEQGRKSPEMVSRKLILGQSSFDLGKNGELLNEKNKPKSPVMADNKENTEIEEKTNVVVERLISMESNSDSSTGSFPHKKTQRHSSVWSMASSLTSIDSNEEEMLEQRRLLNLQISRNKNNNRQEEDVFMRGPHDKDTVTEASSTSILSGHKKLRRTSTPKRFRTTSMSNTSPAGVKEVGDTIEEEMFFSDGEGHLVKDQLRDNVSNTTVGGRPAHGEVSTPGNKSILHASASFPILDKKRRVAQLSGIEEGGSFESFGSLTAAGSLDQVSQQGGKEGLVTSKPPLDVQRRGRLERQRTVRDQYVQKLPGQWSRDSVTTVRLRGTGTSARSTDFDLWDSTEEPTTTIKDDEEGRQDYDDSPNVTSDGAVRRRRGTQRNLEEDVLNDEGTQDKAMTTCSWCGGILVCLKCRVGGGSVDSKDATAGDRAVDICDTFYSATSGLRDDASSKTHQWAATSKNYRDSGQTFDGTRSVEVEKSDPIYRGIEKTFVLEMKRFISEAAERLVLAKSRLDRAGDPNDKFEERRTIQELEIDKDLANTTSPILLNQSESYIENVLCNNSDEISPCTSKSSRKAKRRKSKTLAERNRTLSTSSAEEVSKPDPSAILSPFPPNAAELSVVSPTRRRVPLKFSKGFRSFLDIGDPPSDAAPHSTTGDDGKPSAVLLSDPSNGQAEHRQDKSVSNELNQLLGLFTQQLRVCERLERSLQGPNS